MKTVKIIHTYDVSATLLWSATTQYKILEQVAGRTISFKGLPDGEIIEGQSINVTISLLGLFPRQEYNIDIVLRDDTNKILRSAESGAGVNKWNHTATVSTWNSGSMLTDTIEIEAGWLTIPAAIWANIIYRRRHKPRLRILARAC